jgi:hypothetical protein
MVSSKLSIQFLYRGHEIGIEPRNLDPCVAQE